MNQFSIYSYKTLDFIINSRLNRLINLFKYNNNLKSLQFIGVTALTEKKTLEICQYCPSLEYLCIRQCSYNYYVKDMELLAKYCPKIKKLHYGRNSMATFINDDILKSILTNFYYLEELNISFSSLTDKSAKIWELARINIDKESNNKELYSSYSNNKGIK